MAKVQSKIDASKAPKIDTADAVTAAQSAATSWQSMAGFEDRRAAFCKEMRETAPVVGRALLQGWSGRGNKSTGGSPFPGLRPDEATRLRAFARIVATFPNLLDSDDSIWATRSAVRGGSAKGMTADEVTAIVALPGCTNVAAALAAIRAPKSQGGQATGKGKGKAVKSGPGTRKGSTPQTPATQTPATPDLPSVLAEIVRLSGVAQAMVTTSSIADTATMKAYEEYKLATVALVDKFVKTAPKQAKTA